MMTDTKVKNGYESPKIRVLEVEVEKGFATSDISGVDPNASGSDMPWISNF